MKNALTLPQNTAIRFIRKKEVLHLTGLSSASVYSLMSADKFPKSIKLSEKSVAWLLSDVLAWQEKRLSENGHATTTNAQ